MATIEEALYAKLVATSGVTSLVSTRIYPVVAAQSVAGADYITYELVSGSPHHDMAGPEGLAWARVSYLCHSGSYANARAIAAAVLGALDGYRGTASTVDIWACLSEGVFAVGFDEEARVHTVAADFMVQYEE